MTTDASSKPSIFYLACCNNDFKTVQEHLIRSEIDAIGPEGNTALHAASMHGHYKLVRHLLRYGASPRIQNAKGLIAEQLAPNEAILKAFELPVRPVSDSDYFVGSEREVEWLDSYKNAYRISYENHEHMRRWLTKVSLKKLLDEIDNGYINNLPFSNESQKATIKQYLAYVIELEDPLGLLQAYTHAGTRFYTFLNRDLAEFGSDFRFVTTQALINSGYLDNEAPQGLGQYIFASILVNHPRFQPYHHMGVTYRGMNIKEKELEEYKKEDIIMTRSFLSTSKERDVAEIYLDFYNYDKHIPVISIYNVINRRSSLYIREVSQIPDEDEVLIIPFTVFEVKDKRDIEVTREGKSCRIVEIELEERSDLI